MGSVQRFPAPDVIVRGSAEVGESPFFDMRTGNLCWVDMLRGILFEHDLRSGAHRSSELRTLIGAVVPRASASGFAVAAADGFGLWAQGAFALVDRAVPEPYRRMNDGKCDSRGRFWAGSTHVDGAAGEGALHRWDSSGPSVVIRSGLSLPNGIGWNLEDDRMYLVDSVAHQLLSARFNAEDGTVGEFLPLCSVDTGLPDGLAVDVEGCVWLAVWGGYMVLRIRLSGEVVGIVPMPVKQPSSCAFGEDGTLYVTSARAGLSERELAEQPAAGSVFAVATRTFGVPVSRFAS